MYFSTKLKFILFFLSVGQKALWANWVGICKLFDKALDKALASEALAMCLQIGQEKEINSNRYLFALMDTLLNHKNNTHSNRLFLVLKVHCNFHIHKRTDKNPQAWFLLFENHMQDKLLLICVQSSYLMF